MCTAPIRSRLCWLCVLSVGGLSAQPVIGAKAGLVSYALGRVSVDGHVIEVSSTRFPDIKENSVLRTGRGLAEVLLGPCSAVRLGHYSSIRLMAASPVHPRLELLNGSAVVDITAIARESDVALQARSALVTMARAGVYRMDFLPQRLKVFAGRATVRSNERDYDVGTGRILSLADAVFGKFDRQPTDELDRWSGRRGAELAEMRTPKPPSRDAGADVVSSENNAEFSRYNGGRRGSQGPMPLTTNRSGLPSPCIAGR